MCQSASSATCFGAVAQTKGIRCSRPSCVRGTAVLALNGELRGQAPGGNGRARTAARSRISGNGNQAAAPSRHLSCAARSRAFLGANPAYVCAALGSPSTPQRARVMRVSDRLEGH